MLILNLTTLKSGIKAYLPKSGQKKDQPFYHVYAENEEVFYTAYVSQQNLLADNSLEPVAHPDVHENFGPFDGKKYEILEVTRN